VGGNFYYTIGFFIEGSCKGTRIWSKGRGVPKFATEEGDSWVDAG
jgi:hypothetical protein